MIGELIREFDNSLGTVQDFNRIFPFAKIKELVGDVEILGIAKHGGTLIRNISVDGKIRLHCFSKKYKPDVSLRTKRYLYKAEKKDEIMEFKSTIPMSKFFGISTGSLCDRINKPSYSKVIDGWTISRRLR